MPTAWLDELKKSLLRPKPPEAGQSLSAPVDLAQARLQEPTQSMTQDNAGYRYNQEGLPQQDASPEMERFLLTSGEAQPRPVPPMSPPVNVPPDSGTPPQANLAQMRLQEPSAPSRFTPRPEYKPIHRPGEAIGLGQRILHALKGAGLGALEGMQHGGLLGAVGGATAGGISAGVNPENLHRLRYNTRDLPMWRQRVGDEIEIGKAEQGTRESEARITNLGIDNDLAARRQAATEAQNKTSEAYRTDQLAENRLQHRTVNAQTAKAEHDLRHPGQPYPPNVTDAMPWLKGEKAPSAAAKAGAPHFVPETGGRMIWDAAQGKMVPTPGAETLGPQHDKFDELSAAQKLAVERDQQRQDRQDRQEHTRNTRAAEVVMGKAQRAIDLARRYGQSDDLKLRAQAPTMIENALAAIEEATTSYPDLLEGGPGTGGFPYIKWAGGKKPVFQGATRGGATISQGEYQQQVQKHGQAKVDAWLKTKGIAVQ